MSLKPGTLWVVATPLGNPGDLSPRARETLERVDMVLAEDTRRTGQLLARCGLSAKAMTSLHEHNETERVAHILEELGRGRDAALVSDAGTPLFSDPGYRLVRACRKAGLPVAPVPGPSAPVAALSASGIAPLPYVFLGFPPRRASGQKAFFLPYRDLETTVVFFERKDRVHETLAAAAAVFGRREVCVAREVTKTYEEFIFFSLEEHAALTQDLLGEITVIIGPPEKNRRDSEARVLACLEEEAGRGGKPREVARRVQERVAGWSGKEIYALLREREDQRA